MEYRILQELIALMRVPELICGPITTEIGGIGDLFATPTSSSNLSFERPIGASSSGRTSKVLHKRHFGRYIWTSS
jgi:hypothetical protein